jgi:hypothetical protein
MLVYRSLVFSLALQWRQAYRQQFKRAYLPMSSMVCYQSGPVARLLKWPRFLVVNLHPNTLHKCHAVWMTKSRGSRTGNVSRESGGLKMKQCRSLGSGTGDIETVPSEPEGVAGSSKMTSSTPVHLRCRALSEYVERHRILTTRKGWLWNLGRDIRMDDEHNGQRFCQLPGSFAF